MQDSETFEGDWGLLIQGYGFHEDASNPMVSGAETDGFLADHAPSATAKSATGFSQASVEHASGQPSHVSGAALQAESRGPLPQQLQTENSTSSNTNTMSNPSHTPQTSQDLGQGSKGGRSDSLSWEFLDGSQAHNDCHECEQGDDAVSCDDSDCSVAGLCPSQCGESGQGSICCNETKCQPADLCLDDCCEEASHPCNDENCAIDGMRPLDRGEEAEAAVALQSFGEMNSANAAAMAARQSRSNMFYPEPSDNLNQASTHTSLIGTSFGHMHYRSTGYPYGNSLPYGNINTMNMANQDPLDIMLRANPQFIMGNHLFQHHDMEHQHGADNSACIAENPSNMPDRCSLPLFDGNMSSLLSYNHWSQCGFQADNPAMWQQHVLHEHGALFSNFGMTVPDLDCGDLDQFSWPQPTPTSFHGTPEDSTPSMMHGWPPANGAPQVTGTPQGFSDMPSPPQMTTTGIKTIESPTDAIKTDAEAPSDDEGPPRCLWMNPATKTVCNAVFATADELDAHCKQAHVKMAQKTKSEIFECYWEGCAREVGFPQKGKLTRHVQTHTGYKPMQCHICGLRLSAKQALDQHIRTHTNEKPFVCSFPGCGLQFRQHSALIMHNRTHTGERPLKCKECGATFRESSNLTKHKRTHETKGRYFCPICEKDFNRRDQLRRHLANNHKDNPDGVRAALESLKSFRTTTKSGTRAQAVPMGRTASNTPSTASESGPSPSPYLECKQTPQS